MRTPPNVCRIASVLVLLGGCSGSVSGIGGNGPVGEGSLTPTEAILATDIAQVQTQEIEHDDAPCSGIGDIEHDCGCRRLFPTAALTPLRAAGQIENICAFG